MHLTLEQIKACAFGTLRVWEEEDHFRFARMTESLEDAFTAIRPAFRERARSTTDCRLDFHTDSRSITVEADSENPEDTCKIEVLVDGLPRLFEEFAGRREISLTLPEGDKRVTVALPCHTVGRIFSLRLDDSAYIKPHAFDRKILFLGDSITQGWQSGHDAQSYAGNVARLLNAESVNWAVGGSCFDPTFVEKSVFDPDMVIVSYGTNDYSARKDIAQFVAFCRGHLEKVKEFYGHKKVFVITPIWRADYETLKGTGSLLDCAAAVQQEAEALGFTVLDGFTLFPHSREYMADGYLHPNDLGFAHYSINLYKAILAHIS